MLNKILEQIAQAMTNEGEGPGGWENSTPEQRRDLLAFLQRTAGPIIAGALAAKPATTGQPRWVYAVGGTLEEMQDEFRKTALYAQGDAELVWVNEGDLLGYQLPDMLKSATSG